MIKCIHSHSFTHTGGHSYTHRAVASYFRVVCEKLQLSRSFTSEKLSHTCMDALLLCIHYSHSSLDISSSICIVYSLLFFVKRRHWRNCMQTAFSWMRRKRAEQSNSNNNNKKCRAEIRALSQGENKCETVLTNIAAEWKFESREKNTHTNCVCVFLSMLIVAINFHSVFRKWFVRVILLNSNNKYSSYQVLDLHVQCALMLCRHALGTHTHTYTPVHSLCILRLGFNSICR